ncbi:MAG TPA: Uma2 family endonuclease [Geminicoccaceae bacterium]
MIRRDRDRRGEGTRTSIPAFLDRARETNERLELRGGRIFVTTRAGTIHDLLRARTAKILRRQLEGRPWRVLEGEAVQLDQHNVLRPDIAIVFSAQDRPRIAADPVAVVEIIEPATADVDRGERGQHYRDVRSVEHYVLISTDAQRVELFSREAARSWSYRSYDGLHRMVPLATLDITLLLAAVYEGIDIAAGGRRAGL